MDDDIENDNQIDLKIEDLNTNHEDEPIIKELEDFDLKQSNIQTNFQSTMNLLNNCLGFGILGISFAFTKSNLLFGLILMFISAQSIDMCIECDIPINYIRLGKHLLGPFGKYLITFSAFLSSFICMTGYLIVSKDSIKKIFFINDVQSWILAISINFVFSFARKLSFVAILSSIAFFSCLSICLLLIYDDVIQMFDHAINDLEFNFDINDINLVFPMFVATFSMPIGGNVILANLKDNTPHNRQIVTMFAFILVFILNVGIGVMSMLRFDNSKINGDILLEYPRNDVFSIICGQLALILIILSQMFMITPARVTLAEQLFNKNEIELELTDFEYIGLTSVINMFAFIFALFFKKLRFVIALNGATNSAILIFILPPILQFVKCQKKENKFDQKIVLHDSILMIIGIQIMISGIQSNFMNK